MKELGLALLLSLIVVMAGCAEYTATDTTTVSPTKTATPSTTITSTTTGPTTTTDVTLTDREPTHRLKILAESEMNISVRLAERSGSVVYNRTHHLEDTLVLDLSDEFTAGTAYNVTVWVNGTRSWQGLIPPSYGYRLTINADGNVSAYRVTS
jgi:hypothetical protein